MNVILNCCLVKLIDNYTFLPCFNPDPAFSLYYIFKYNEPTQKKPAVARRRGPGVREAIGTGPADGVTGRKIPAPVLSDPVDG